MKTDDLYAWQVANGDYLFVEGLGQIGPVEVEESDDGDVFTFHYCDEDNEPQFVCCEPFAEMVLVVDLSDD